jgi:hypothetical protein
MDMLQETAVDEKGESEPIDKADLDKMKENMDSNTKLCLSWFPTSSQI